MRAAWPRVYVAVAALAVAGFASVGALLAVTLPYHQWDSFGFGNWSRLIAHGGTLDPLAAGSQSASRPLFYELQGALWSATGISFTAGRLLSLAFALVLIGSVIYLQRALNAPPLETALAAAVVVAIPLFAQQALSGQTDVPAAAMVALAAALALRRPASRWTTAATVAAACAAVLTKQTVLLALVPFAVLLALLSRRRPAGALAAGLAFGVAYDLVMAHRFHQGLIAFLTEGSTGFWATLADRTRADAVLRADVLGAGLRLPLTFALLYAIARVCRLRHRLATLLALGAALVWCIAGPLAAGVTNGAFARAEDGFTLIGFAVILCAAAFVADEDAPGIRTLSITLGVGLVPLLVWVKTGTYTDRLAAPAWPGLAVLIACVLGAGIRGLARGGMAAALVPLPVLATAVWMSLAMFDGLHGPMWTEYRSLGRSAFHDKQRTMHVVLPALQSTLATAEPAIGDGRLVTGDPMVPWFLPDRVDSRTPERCGDLKGERVFVLLTGDESVAEARLAGRLATPEQWARCKAPAVQQLSDGSNGYAVFAIQH
jgi:hypothetical protein